MLFVSWESKEKSVYIGCPTWGLEYSNIGPKKLLKKILDQGPDVASDSCRISGRLVLGTSVATGWLQTDWSQLPAPSTSTMR